MLVCGIGQLEQWQGLDDTGESTALTQVLRRIGLEEGVDPIVTVLDNAVAEHLGDLLECFFGLLACLSLRVTGAMKRLYKCLRDIYQYVRARTYRIILHCQLSAEVVFTQL